MHVNPYRFRDWEISAVCDSNTTSTCNFGSLIEHLVREVELGFFESFRFLFVNRAGQLALKDVLHRVSDGVESVTTHIPSPHQEGYRRPLVEV